MTTCLVIDQTDENQFPDYENFPRWEQSFSRVPTIGECIVKEGKGLKVESVIWDENGRVTLTVE